MQFEEHLHLIVRALGEWFAARLYDSLIVGALWWAGLRMARVPLAPLWAALAGLLQFIPHLGPALALVGPAAAAAIAGGENCFFIVLLLYAGITAGNGLAIEPLLFKRVARIPIWASQLVPVGLGLALSFWGVVLAAPLLAVYYAYWGAWRQSSPGNPNSSKAAGS